MQKIAAKNYFIAADIFIIVFLVVFFVFEYRKIPESVAVYVAPQSAPEIILPKNNPPVSVLFVGDIMLGRHVETLMNIRGKDYPFLLIDPLLRSTDRVVANLEGPIIAKHVQTVNKSLRFSFATGTAKLLVDHNISIVSLGNNHLFDFSSVGFIETENFLDEAGVLHAGNPFDINDDYTAREEVNGRQFVYISFNATNPNFDSKKALSLIQNTERTDGDFLIVLVHGGEEYKTISNESQHELYRGFVDAGADLVVGHHPHVVQDVEIYRNKAIFYSLGNFIFDQYFSNDVKEGLAVRLTLSSEEVVYDLLPLESKESQPMQMNEAEKALFLAKLSARSDIGLSQDIENGTIILLR